MVIRRFPAKVPRAWHFVREEFIHGVSPGLKASDKHYELPTSEIPSGSDVGIGSMPGNIWESGVATLPDERINGRPYGQGHTGFEGCFIPAFSFRLFIFSF